MSPEGQVRVGTCVSRTLTWKLQRPMLPAASLATHSTEVMPTGKKEPEAGVQVTFVITEQRSMAVAAEKVTTAPHWSGSVFLSISAEHKTVGEVISITVTSALQEFVNPKSSVMVRVTAVIPSG